MPHKRAKHSVREEQRLQIGSDQVPSSNQTSKHAISSEGIPKSVARVLNAAHVRQEWREKKRKPGSSEDTGERGGKNKRRRIDGGGDMKRMEPGKTKGQPDDKAKKKMLSIQPGESLGHFNRQVEDGMRPLVKSAVQSSSAQARKVKKSELDAKSKSKSKNTATAADTKRDPSQRPEPVSKHDGRPTEFQKSSTSAPRRLNDIAQAPPEFKKLPRGVKDRVDKTKALSGREGVLSMKQKLMMEEEREKAIARYRALKERRRLEGGGGGERYAGGDDDE